MKRECSSAKPNALLRPRQMRVLHGIAETAEERMRFSQTGREVDEGEVLSL